jgi:allantoinase
MSQAFRSTRVLTPQGLIPATLLIEQERITGVCGWDEVPAVARLRDYGDYVLLPGLVDSHVHINEPGRTEWEGFTTATQAAAAGGVTTLVDMPLNCIPEIVDVHALERKRAAAAGKTWVDWAAWGGLVRGNVNALAPLASAGVPGFKCFLVFSGIDGFSWLDEAHLSAGLTSLRGTGLPLLAHAEVCGPIDSATEKLNNAGADWRKYSTYLASRPDNAEVDAIAMLIRLAEEFESPIHIVHLSSALALPLLADARQRGVPVTVETCTQYLWFAAEDIPDGATEFKCAPPIRGAANREALWGALADGIIDMVTTDHSPCPPALKHRDPNGGLSRWDLAWGGISSLGLALPVMWTAMVRRGLGSRAGIEQLGRWMASRPAQLAGLQAHKGAFTVGADADIVIFDPDAEWTVAPEHLHFRHKLSPYLGAKLRGLVQETWLRGAPVYTRSMPPASPGLPGVPRPGSAWAGSDPEYFVGHPRGQELIRS